MPVSDISKYINQFTGFYTFLAQKIVLDIMRQLRGVTDPYKARIIIERVCAKYQIESKLANNFLEGITGAVKVGAGLAALPDPIAIKRWYLNRAYAADIKVFKPSVNDLFRVDEIVSTVTKSMRIGEAWRTAAQRLSDTGIQRGDVASAIEDLRKHARQAFSLADDPQGYRAYKQAIARAQAGVDKLIDPSTSKLRRAYQDVINATKTGSAQATEGALKYAAYFKQRYNAERIVKTETARAYGQAFYSEAIADQDVGWIRWELNSGHEIFDICNLNADADLYGLGRGCYPLNSVPQYPAHPGCLCNLATVYSTSGPARAQLNDRKAQAYLRQLPADQKRDLMGVAGAQAFNDNPGTWRKQVNNWEDHQPARATIPTNILYGGK